MKSNRSHNKALLKLFDQVLQVNNLQKFQTLFSVLQKSCIRSWFKIETVDEDSTAVANQDTAAGAVNEDVKNMKAKLQSARDKLKNKLKDESSTADDSEIADPLVDNAVDDLVEVLRAELKSYEDSIMKCSGDRVKVLNLRKVAKCVISNCKRRFEEWSSSSGNLRSCKRKRVSGY
ncbi:hypothetical protein MKW92_037892 [Papaver armeniacum]|nr:hypothetical protein MKW92_037892 [Papaver armeniacum]